MRGREKRRARIPFIGLVAGTLVLSMVTTPVANAGPTPSPTPNPSPTAPKMNAASANNLVSKTTSITSAAQLPAQNPEAPGKAAPPPPITPAGAVDPGPASTVSVGSGPSPALTPIHPLPAVAPAPGSVTVPSAPFVAKPAVTPSPLVLPTHPGQDLVDATTTDATDTLRAAGRLNSDGTPNLDATTLQPQMPSAKFVDPAHRATLQDLINALTSGNFPPPLPVDPLALLQALPDGIPRITYRVCSESDSKAASCSLTLPLAVPALVDVTGDHTPDVLMDMVPIVAPGDIIGAATQLLDVQKQITDVQNTLNGILQILQDPLQAILHPELLVEKLQLTKTLADLESTLQQKLTALTDLIDVGVAVLEVRLPTSETTGKALHAQVWGVYDLPTHKRLSVGFDGFRRGDTLPLAGLGLYTFNIGHFLQGIYDIHANVLQVGAGKALAITAGLGTVSSDSNGDVVNPTVASARFSPVPLLFSAHAVIDPGSDSRPETASVDATSTSSSELDAQVLSDGPSSDSFTQAKIDTLPTQVSAKVTRQAANATVNYSASSGINNVLFANFDYSGAQLENATQVKAAKVPSRFDATLQAGTPDGSGSDNIAFHYTNAPSQLASLDADYLDRGNGIVGRGSLRKLPTQLDLVVDRPTSHLTLNASQPIGSAALNVSRDLGAYAPIPGDHATLVTSGSGVGISAQVSGLKSIDAYYDSHPRLKATFDPGGQRFEAAANLDGDQKAQATVTNLPPSLTVDADTATGKIAYGASAVVHRVQVAYTKVSSGPTLFAAVNELPQTVNVTYALGDKPEVTYQASSSVPRVEVFASKDHIESLSPNADHYISALLTDLPKQMDYALDIPNHHLEGTSDQPFGGVDVVARLPIQGRDWTGDGKLAGIPTHFDADFGGGTMRFRGLSGPLSSAAFTVTNHAGAVEPTGLHLAAHYRQSTGDIDGSVAVQNLTTVEYSHTATDQTFNLQMNTGSAPVYIDADALLGADDTRLSGIGRVTDLPTTLTVTSANGKLTYSADKHIGIELEVHLGKVAAINQTVVPLFPNGVSAMAAACSGGAGCASDSSAFCTVFTGHCFGLTAILNLPGLPTSVTVDTKARTVAVAGYAPPSSELQAYLRLTGLISALPDIRALATLSHLPSPVDFTVGPMDFNGSTVDAMYSASAPLGTLTIDGQATTTNTQFPELRARVTAGTLPARFHITGQFGQSTVVHVDDSAAVGAIGVVVTSPSTGYLDGSITGVPASADVTADLAKQHIQADMSSAIGGVHLLAHVPYKGRTWSAYVNVLGIPGTFTVDYAGGSFQFNSQSGPLHEAAAAITNYGGATAPSGPHLAVHYRQSTDDMDASARIDDLTSVQYTHGDHDFTVKAAVAPQSVALDGDVVLADAQHRDDVRLAARGTLGPIPSSFTIGSAGGVITYSADSPLNLTAELWLGKVKALGGLGVHEFANGISIADAGCSIGAAGCASGGPFDVSNKGIGAVGIINVSGLPKQVTVDPSQNKYSFSGYQPKTDSLDLYIADTAFVPAPLTGAKAWVTLQGLPSAIDFTVGPITTGAKTHVEWSSNVKAAGKLTARAEAFNVPVFNDARAVAVLDPIPGSLKVDGTFGKDSEVSVNDSVPISDLSMTATGTFKNNPASGMVAFTGIPIGMDFKGGGFQSGSGQKIPTVSYSGKDDTLSGVFHVEGKLAANFEPGAAGGLSDAYLSFTKMGRNFAITYNPSDKTAQVTSTPATVQVKMGVAVFFEGDFNYTFDGNQHLFDVDHLLYGTLDGHANIHNSTLGLMVTMNDISNMSLMPGKKNSGLPLNISLPDWFGYLFLGVKGSYGSVDIQDYDVNLNPDVDINFRIQRTFSPVDLFATNLKLGPASSLWFRRYSPNDTSTEPFDLNVGPVSFGCLTLKTKPGLADAAQDGVHLKGSDGPQMVSFADPGNQVNGWIFDLFAYATTPIGGMSFDWGLSPLGC